MQLLRSSRRTPGTGYVPRRRHRQSSRSQPSSLTFQDVLESAVGVNPVSDLVSVRSPFGDWFGPGMLAAERVHARRFGTDRERVRPVVTVGPDSLLTSGAPLGGLPAPSAPSLPGVPGPAGAPGCPGHSGSGSGGSGSLQVAATTPFGPQLVLAHAQHADGDHAAALLTRCDEPGSSPD